MKYNSGSNQASNFKIKQAETQGRFEITCTSMITPELCDKRSNYYLIVSITKFEIKKLFGELHLIQKHHLHFP